MGTERLGDAPNASNATKRTGVLLDQVRERGEYDEERAEDARHKGDGDGRIASEQVAEGAHGLSMEPIAGKRTRMESPLRMRHTPAPVDLSHPRRLKQPAQPGVSA